MFIRFYPCAKFISQIYSIRRSTELARDIRAIVVGWEEAEVEEVVKRRQSQASCFCSTVDDAGMPRSWTDSHENSTVADIISFFSMGTLLKDCQKSTQADEFGWKVTFGNFSDELCGRANFGHRRRRNEKRKCALLTFGVEWMDFFSPHNMLWAASKCTLTV